MIGILALVLFVLLLAVGGERGAVAVMALAGNIGVLSLTILLLAKGFSPFWVLLAASLAISYITLFKQNGRNLKTLSAFVTVAAVMLVLSVIIYWLVWRAGGGGLNEIQAVQEDVTIYYNVNINVDMLHIAVSVTVLGALGAVMDTALSVTSSVHEVAVHKSELGRRELYQSGLQVGRDIIGTTVNTLLFAYLAESMMLFAYLQKGLYTREMILNSKFLFQEISVMLFSMIACLLSVPLAAFLAAHFIKKR